MRIRPLTLSSVEVVGEMKPPMTLSMRRMITLNRMLRMGRRL